MSNAYDFWGTSCYSGGSGQANCNGDGSNTIDYGGYANGERSQMWNHMNLAGIISHKTHNTFSSTTYPEYPTTNKDDCVFYAYHVSGAQLRMYISGKAKGVASQRACFTPSDAKSIDLKVDDGVANAGLFRAGDGVDVTAGNCQTSGVFNGSNSANACYIMHYIEAKGR